MCNTMQEEFFPFRINQDSLTLIFLWQMNSKYHQTWLKSVNLRNKIEPQHVSINKLKIYEFLEQLTFLSLFSFDLRV